MTAETLKPFLTPTSAAHFTAPPSDAGKKRRRKSNKIIFVGLSASCILLAIIFVGVAVWHSLRIYTLEEEVRTLNRLVESMRVRLGLNYLEDLEDFKKEYTNVMIEIPNNTTESDNDDEIGDNSNNDEDDDDDDFYASEYTDLFENDDDLDAMVKKYNSYDDSIDTDDDNDDDDNDDDDDDNDNDNDDNGGVGVGVGVEDDDDDDSSSDIADGDASDDDNLYDDYGKFKDSKKKKRKTRAIANASNGLPVYEHSFLAHLNRTTSGAMKQDSSERKKEKKKHDEIIQNGNRMTSSMRAQQPPRDASQDNNGPNYKVSNFMGQRLDERKHYSQLSRRGPRKRKVPIMKSGESLLSAKLTQPQRHQAAISFLPAAHFHLSNKVPDRHAAIKVNSYPGDMYIGTPSVSHAITQDHFFKVDNGVLTIREPGLYYIYAQICYNNTHDQNGFVIFHGHKPFLQCLNTVPTNMPLKIHTCHTSGLIHLRANETIHLRDFHTDRNVILKDTNNRSYFGLIKI